MGSILQICDGIVRLWGREDARAGVLREFPGGVRGVVLSREDAKVGAALVVPGRVVKRFGKGFL